MWEGEIILCGYYNTVCAINSFQTIFNEWEQDSVLFS